MVVVAMSALFRHFVNTYPCALTMPRRRAGKLMVRASGTTTLHCPRNNSPGASIRIPSPLLNAFGALEEGRGAHRSEPRCAAASLSEALQQVVPDAQRVGHCGERRVHGTDAGKEARVDNI